MLDERRRRLGQQDLPPIPCSTNARGPMDIQPDVAPSSRDRLASMESHAHTHRCLCWPGIGSEGPLRHHRRCNRLRCTAERHKEPVPRRVNLITVPLLENRPQQFSICCQNTSVSVSEVLEETGGMLNVAEQESDCSSRQVSHAERPPFPAPVSESASPCMGDPSTVEIRGMPITEPLGKIPKVLFLNMSETRRNVRELGSPRQHRRRKRWSQYKMTL